MTKLPQFEIFTDELTSEERDANSINIQNAEFLTWLKNECGYLEPKPLTARPGWWAAVMPFMYTHAIVAGRMGDRYGYEDRWCYHGRTAALAALEAWNGAGEPTGWHRHPGSGRRKSDDGTEYVAP